MYLLDADTYTHLLLKHPRVVENAAAAVARGEDIGIPLITKIEVLRGRFEALLKADSRDRFLTMQRRLFRAEEALRQITIVPLDAAAIDHFEQLSVTKGLGKIGRADLLIASIVLARDSTLATRNLKHFRLVPRLKLANWVD
jgi:tRNA(fMet)-specific endonuclease VapC